MLYINKCQHDHIGRFSGFHLKKHCNIPVSSTQRFSAKHLNSELLNPKPLSR